MWFNTRRQIVDITFLNLHSNNIVSHHTFHQATCQSTNVRDESLVLEKHLNRKQERRCKKQTYQGLSMDIENSAGGKEASINSPTPGTVFTVC